jgi:hypothetical protein
MTITMGCAGIGIRRTERRRRVSFRRRLKRMGDKTDSPIRPLVTFAAIAMLIALTVVAVVYALEMGPYDVCGLGTSVTHCYRDMVTDVGGGSR